MDTKSTNSTKPTLYVITGANRGLGYESVVQMAQMKREHMVIIVTARTLEKAKKAVSTIKPVSSCTLIPFEVEMTNYDHHKLLATYIDKNYGYLDVLIQNAGIAMNGFNKDVAENTLKVNVHSVLALDKVMIPLLQKKKTGTDTPARIVHVASRAGLLSNAAPFRRKSLLDKSLSFDDFNKLCKSYVDSVAKGGNEHFEVLGWPKTSGYSTSKILLNTANRQLAANLNWMTPDIPIEKSSRTVLVNSLCPGWCSTDMGGQRASKSPKEGGTDIVIAATRDLKKPSGEYITGQFFDRYTALNY